MTLLAAASALEALAAGLEPRLGDVLSGAFVLQSLVGRGEGDRDFQDAALGLEALATGRALNLDSTGRARAADSAMKVRAFASTSNASHRECE